MTKIDGQKARDDASTLISHLGPGGNTNLGDGIIKGLDVSEAAIKSNSYEKPEHRYHYLDIRSLTGVTIQLGEC